MVYFEALAAYSLEVGNDAEAVRRLYSAAKDAVAKGAKVKNGRMKGSFKEDFDAATTAMRIGGWGILKWEGEEGEGKHSGIMTATDSLVGSYAKGKMDSPSDHILRGLIAGAASVVFGTEIDAVETECIAVGSPACRFVIDSSSNLKKNFKLEYEAQIGS